MNVDFQSLVELKTEAENSGGKSTNSVIWKNRGGGVKNRPAREKVIISQEGAFSLLEEMRFFALAFTGKCRTKQSGIMVAPRARSQAATGQKNILQI